MARNSKGKSSCWYGYLMASKRSSPVLRDSRLETGNPKTIYLFNLKRGEIIEYALEVVEKKLRDLRADESSFIQELVDGYDKARSGFSGRGSRKRSYSEATIISLYEVANEDDDDAFDGDDSADWLDSEEA